MGWKCSCQGLDVCNGDLREEKIHQGGAAPVFFWCFSDKTSWELPSCRCWDGSAGSLCPTLLQDALTS